MLTRSTIRKIHEFEREYGSGDGACFGTVHPRDSGRYYRYGLQNDRREQRSEDRASSGPKWVVACVKKGESPAYLRRYHPKLTFRFRDAALARANRLKRANPKLSFAVCNRFFVGKPGERKLEMLGGATFV